MIPETWLKDVGDQVVKDYIEDDRQSSASERSQVKHVIEHRIATPRQQQPQYLPPINQPPLPPRIIQHQQPVVVHPPPPPVIMQQQQPQIIQGPPQHIIQQYPNPVIQNLGPSQPDNRAMFNKADFGEMMMMQNAQMHQMVMQKLMIGSLGRQEQGGSGCHDCHGGGGGCCSTPSCHHGYDYAPAVAIPVPRASPGGAVHHHHYSNPPPPSQPAIHHYSTMPAMDIRGGYPMQGEFSGDPYSYYEYYQ